MILQYNLQFFAKDGPGGEKTEPATQKKLDDARKDGQVAKSKELGNGVSLIAIFLILKFFIGDIGVSFLAIFEGFYKRITEYTSIPGGEISSGSFVGLINMAIIEMLLMMMPFFIVGCMVAIVTDLVQVKWKPTTKPLKPKFNKFNPVSGMKRMFSVNSLMELAKSIAKVVLITYVVYSTLKDKMGVIFSLYDVTFMHAIQLMGEIIIDLGLKISIIYMIIAFADFAFQKWKFKEDMKMTKQEVKDEYKNAEGSPEIKGKQRQRMREASQRRMMQSIPQADVVITNPTHFAVAIRYDAQSQEAPVVVAKGADYLAAKIKDIAKEHHVEIVENKPLARMLYHNVELDAPIPPELYQAVAEILAMVYKIQGKI